MPKSPSSGDIPARCATLYRSAFESMDAVSYAWSPMSDFEARFPSSQAAAGAEPLSVPWPESEPALGMLRRNAGVTFNDGLYRIHSRSSLAQIEPSVATGFPQFAGKWTPFGFDWLGRQFACRRGTDRDEGPLLMFEPGTGEALELPMTVWQFHEDQLVNDPEPAVAASFFHEWIASGGRPLAHDEVLGYKVPLFLGGQDSIENLEVSDVEVYWVLMSQLLRQARGLPPGTPIGTILGG